MKRLLSAFSYSVGRKVVMALTGLFLIVFLVEHLIGNFLLLKDDGGEAFNAYSASMVHNLLIRVVEVLLFASIIVHVVDGLQLALSARTKRNRRYAVRHRSGSWTARNMIITGMVILVFLVVHLYTFFVPYRIVGIDGTLYDLVVAAFASPVYVAFYVGAFVFLALHLKHAFVSSFQTLGLRHLKYDRLIEAVGTLYAVLVPLGYAVIAIAIYLKTI